MTEERMIRIDYESWYSQNFIIPDWEDMEPAPPKDWKPWCFVPADLKAHHINRCGAFGSGIQCIECPFAK